MIGKIRSLNKARNIKTRKLKNAIKLFKYRLFYRKKTQLNIAEYKKICLFMHSQAIGDVLVTSGFITALRNKGFDVCVVINKKIEHLFESMIPVDGKYIIDSKNIKQVTTELNKRSIDLVVDFSDFENTSAFREKTLSLINCKHAISFNHPDSTTYDTNLIYTESKHITSRMKDVLLLLGIDDECIPAVHFNNTLTTEAKNFIATLGKKVIILNPFASKAVRSLSIPQIYTVLNYLDKLEGYVTVVFDLGIKLDISSYKNTVLNPFNDIERSFALIQFADFVITVDTSIVHMASLLNIKQYCIYNNRKFNLKFENNTVWGPNSALAVQFNTNEFIGSDIGDDVSKFDISLLINRMASDIADLR